MQMGVGQSCDKSSFPHRLGIDLTVKMDDPNMSIDAMGLLSSICDIKFVFGLQVLKTVFFSNTMNTLSVFLQSQKMVVITASKTVGPTIESARW